MDSQSPQTKFLLESLRKHWRTTKGVETTISYMQFGQTGSLQRGQQVNLHFSLSMVRKLVMRFLQEANEEADDFSRIINQIIKLNENIDEVHYKLWKYKNKMKSLFDRKARERDFKEGYLVLRWDSRREDKGKHGKFDNLWFITCSIAEVKGNNTFILQN